MASVEEYLRKEVGVPPLPPNQNKYKSNEIPKVASRGGTLGIHKKDASTTSREGSKGVPNPNSSTTDRPDNVNSGGSIPLVQPRGGKPGVHSKDLDAKRPEGIPPSDKVNLDSPRPASVPAKSTDLSANRAGEEGHQDANSSTTTRGGKLGTLNDVSSTSRGGKSGTPLDVSTTTRGGESGKFNDGISQNSRPGELGKTTNSSKTTRGGTPGKFDDEVAQRSRSGENGHVDDNSSTTTRGGKSGEFSDASTITRGGTSGILDDNVSKRGRSGTPGKFSSDIGTLRPKDEKVLEEMISFLRTQAGRPTSSPILSDNITAGLPENTNKVKLPRYARNSEGRIIREIKNIGVDGSEEIANTHLGAQELIHYLQRMLKPADNLLLRIPVDTLYRIYLYFERDWKSGLRNLDHFLTDSHFEGYRSIDDKIIESVIYISERLKNYSAVKDKPGVLHSTNHGNGAPQDFWNGNYDRWSGYEMADNFYWGVSIKQEKEVNGYKNLLPKFPNKFDEGWWPVVACSFSKGALQSKSFSLPFFRLVIPNSGERPSSLRLTVLDDVTHTIRYYLEKYIKECFDIENNLVLPYKNIVWCIEVYRFDRNISVFYQKGLLCVLSNWQAAFDGATGHAEDELELNFEIVGEYDIDSSNVL